MARHHARGEALDQGGQDIAGGYLAGGGNKYDADRNVYSRPELPIEFEPRFRSRVAATNGDILKRGLFEKEAVGPLEIEPVAEDFYLPARYADGGAPSVDELYFKNSAFKLKRGTHNVT